MSEDWCNLTKEQQDDVNSLREHVFVHIAAEVELFYKKHPEIQVFWSCTLDGFISVTTVPKT